MLLGNLEQLISKGRNAVEQMMEAYSRENLKHDFSESFSITFEKGIGAG